MSQNKSIIPKPTEWVTLIRFSKVDRNISCRFDSYCLDIAAKAHWRGFTCRFCDYNKDPLEGDN